MTKEELVRILGVPDSVSKSSQSAGYEGLKYNAMGVFFHIKGVVFQIDFIESCTLVLESGLGIGSTMEDVFKVYGQPGSRRQVRAAGYGPQQDGELQESPTEYSVAYLSKGLSFFFSKSMGNRVAKFNIYTPRVPR
jgi:hypothetical protein